MRTAPIAFLARGFEVLRTRILFGPRMHHLGRRSAIMRGWHINNPRAVSIGDSVTILDHARLSDLCPGTGTYPKIVIGDGCMILFRFQCNAAQAVHIGCNVLIAANVLISDSDHVVEPGGVPVTRNGRLVTQPVVIEDNCWLGQNAVILKGVTIGHDSIIGANSVVTRNVPPCSVAAGNPARVVRSLAPAADAEHTPLRDTQQHMPVASHPPDRTSKHG